MKVFDVRAVLLALCIGSGIAAAIVTARTPSPSPASAPGGVFSAARAMIDDRIIAARAHPEGSAAALAARDYIVARMAALGLNPHRVSGEAVEVFPRFKGRFASGGSVENLIGVLPGTNSQAAAVLLMAHSDSVPGSPGAADDGAGVTSILEVIRALRAVGPHPRDVIVLITDGEETGLLGARTFFSSGDPSLKHIGMVVNLEARGGGGRVAMFETGAQNGDAIRLFSKAVKNTDALSLMSQIYKYLPNSTDFTVSKGAGYAGFNFAFLGKEFDYHSPSSTPAVLDQGSIQHMGDQALALTRALADASSLPVRSPDVIYSDLLGGPVVAYSSMVGWALLALSGALAVFGAMTGARRSGEALTIGAVARGAGGALLCFLMVLLVLHAAGRLISAGGAFIQGRKLLAEFNWLYASVALLGAGVTLAAWSAAARGAGRWRMAGAAVATGLVSCLMGFDAFSLILAVFAALLSVTVLGGPLQRWAGWFGVLLLGLAITLALQILSPPLTVAIIWPLLMGALAIALMGRFFGTFDRSASMIIALITGAAAAVQLGHLSTPVFVAVGATTPEAMAVITFMAAFALYPLLLGETMIGAIAVALSILAGVVTLFVIALLDPATPRTPRPVQAFYLDDAAAGHEWRASLLDQLDPWSKSALGGAGAITQGDLSPIADTLWLAPTQPVVLARPQFVQTIRQTSKGREVTVEVTPHDKGREIRFYLRPNTPVDVVAINGHPTELEPNPRGWVQLRWTAPTGPLSLTFSAKRSGAMDIRYEEITDGLPPGVVSPPKPPQAMPWGLCDDTVLVDRYLANW